MTTKIINEGGNVVPNAVAIKKQDVAATVKNLQNIMPSGIELHPIGSAGKKEVSSDIDTLIDATDLMAAFPQAKDLKTARQALEAHFKAKGLFAARSGVSVHVGVPIANTQELVQIDVMAVEKAKDAVPLHTHDYSDPTMKGGVLHGIWADLANMSTMPDHESLMMSPYKGLVDRTTKELVTANKDQIASIIIGQGATAKDMGNPAAVLNALKRFPDKYNAIKTKYFPDPVPVGTNEWFRSMFDKLTD
jgi:hypothetical protein